MKKAAMNRKKRLDAPSKQELRERYESARRQNSKDDTNEDLSSTSELPKRPREDQDIQAHSSDLRDKIPKLLRTIAGNEETGSLVVNVGKKTPSAPFSLVDPSYDDSRTSVEMFDYSHKRSDADAVGDDDDLRALIEKQRKTDKQSDIISKKDDLKKSGSTFYDSKVGYTKDHSKSKTSENYWDSKRKESKDSKSSSGKSDRYSKHDVKGKTKKGKDKSKSSYELGFPFFSGSSGAKKTDKPAEEMDINETLKELAYLRSIQTGDNALPEEEEEYFRKLNDLSKPIVSQFDLITTGADAGKQKADGGRKTPGETLSKIESKWDSVIDSMVGTKPVGNTTNDDEITYGPSLPPKKQSLTSKKLQDNSPERKFSRERSLSNSKSDQKASPIAVRGVRGGRGFRGRGMRGGFRGRGRGRGRGGNEFAVAIRGRGRGRSRGRFIRGGYIPSRGRHIFTKGGAKSRRSRSRSSSRSRSRSSSYSRSRSRSRSRGRSNKRRRRSSSSSSYSSSSYSRSRSRSRDRGRGRKQTKRRSRSRSYSSRSRSRSRSQSRSRRRSRSRSTIHSRSRKRSRSSSRSRAGYKKQNKDRARSRSRSKSSSQSRSRKRKDRSRSRSWSFDEDYTKKKNAKSTPITSGTKTADTKGTAKKEQELKIQSKPKKEKTETEMIKPKNKVREPKLEQSNQMKGKTKGKITENVPEESFEKPKADDSNSPAVVALKDLKVTAFSNVFLPRTVSKTVGNISKGMSIGKGRTLPLKKHPVFDAQEEELQEEPEKVDPKELERMKQEKQKFDNEVDKVFNAKSGSKNMDKKRGSWKRVGSPEESPKKEEMQEQQEQKEAELEDNKYEQTEEMKVVEDRRIVESKDTTDEKKTEKEQKKERKEKKRKEKEEKNKRKKEKKEKKGKKNKESSNQENLGNKSKDDVLGVNSQALLDSSKQEQYNQDEYAGYNEYPEGEYQYYEETGQEQGWYDENGVYHPYEEEYLYYYDQEGNIVGYEGPEGYVEGNPFEEQQYYYEGEQQEGVQPEVYGQEAYGTEYTGDAEGYHYPVESQVAEGAQYTGTDNHWQEYAGEAPEQQWYGAEGSYPEGGEAYTEYQYAEGQEGNQYQGGAIEQQVPAQQDADYVVQQGDSAQTFDAPVQAAEEPKTAGDPSENELVLALGKNLAALARLKGWNQQELLDQDPISLVQMLQKPSPAEKPAAAAQERHPEEPRRQLQQDRPLEEPNRQFLQEIKPDEVPRQRPQERQDEARMQYPQERRPGINERRAAEQKPLKSILKKGNSTSLKPPPKTETSTTSPLTKSVPSASTSDHVGPEYIVCISKSGPERFFCKLCQCHIESQMAKELHVKSMKHIELFVREKSSLLHSVIGAKQPEDTAEPGFPSQEDQLPEKREPSPHRSPDREYHEDRDTSEEDPARNRLLDYDRLRLMDWQRREESVSSVESDKPKQFDYGRTEDQDFENRTSRASVEHERYEDRNEHARLPRERREVDWRQDEQGYGRERQHYASERRERDYEKGDYHRERRSLSHDSDRQDDRRSVGSRSSDRSFDGSEKDSRQDHKVQTMAYRNRMPQDARPSARDRPGINQGESSRAAHKEQPSRQEQTAGRDRRDTKRLNQNDRERSLGDTSVHRRGRTSFPPQENRGQAEQGKWRGRGQASRQDNTQQDPGQKVEETSSHSSSSSRIPSDRKEMPRAEGTGRRTEQSVKASEKISQSSPVVERNQGQQGQKTSKDSDSNRNTGADLKDDRDLLQKPAERHPERAAMKPIPSIQSQKEAQEGKRRAREPQQQAPGSANVKPSAALLGDHPKSHILDQKPQEQAKSISTVIQGQRRVPPPPPPYNKGSGPQSFRGRGGQGHPPPPGGRGSYQSRIPPNQPGMMSKPPHSLLPMPPQASSYEVRAPAPSSSMPPRQHFPGDQSMVEHPTPPYYGRGRAVGQPQFRGRGGSPHMSRGGYGGPPQYASRGRGGRGFHGQRW